MLVSSLDYRSLQTVSHTRPPLRCRTSAHLATAAPFCAPPCVCFQLLQPLRRLPVGSLPRRCRLLAEAGCRLAHALPHLLLSRLCCKSCGQQRRRQRWRPLRPSCTCAVSCTSAALQQRLSEGRGRQGAAGTGHSRFAASCRGLETAGDLFDRYGSWANVKSQAPQAGYGPPRTPVSAAGRRSSWSEAHSLLLSIAYHCRSLGKQQHLLPLHTDLRVPRAQPRAAPSRRPIAAMVSGSI